MTALKHNLQLVETQFDQAPLEGLPVAWSSGKNYIKCLDSATEEQVKEAIARVVQFHTAAEHALSFAHLTIGRMILDYQARQPVRTSIEEVIDDLDLEESTGKSWKTIAKWARVVQILPEEELNPKLSISALYAAARQKLPDTPSKMQEWQAMRSEILNLAAEDTERRGARWVERKMQEAQERLGLTPIKRNHTTHELMHKACVLYWLDSLEDSDLAIHGITRAHVKDQIYTAELMLRERTVLPEIGEDLYVPLL